MSKTWYEAIAAAADELARMRSELAARKVRDDKAAVQRRRAEKEVGWRCIEAVLFQDYAALLNHHLSQFSSLPSSILVPLRESIAAAVSTKDFKRCQKRLKRLQHGSARWRACRSSCKAPPPTSAT